jgi:zinc transporter ZupT
MSLLHPVSVALLLAGAVITGGLLVHLIRKELKATLQGMLVFSGAFLLGVSALHLIPEVYEIAPYPGLCLLAGFLVQITAESLSKGVEHGHHHAHGKHVFPITILLGLFLHTYIEAVPLAGFDREQPQTESFATEAPSQHTHNHGHDHGHHHDHQEEKANDTMVEDGHGHHHHDLGESFLWGVLAHKVPMAFALMALMVQAGTSTRKRWIWLLIFACSGPLGIATGHLISNQDILFGLLAVALGSFLHVSTTIILESESGHRFSIRHVALVLAGFGLAWLVSP